MLVKKIDKSTSLGCKRSVDASRTFSDVSGLSTNEEFCKAAFKINEEEMDIELVSFFVGRVPRNAFGITRACGIFLLDEHFEVVKVACAFCLGPFDGRATSPIMALPFFD